MNFPHHYVEKITDLCPHELKGQGLDGLLVDIDGTLKDYIATDFSTEIIEWIRRAREAGLAICLYSNGIVRKVHASATLLGTPYVAKAFKPFPFRCRQGLSALGLPPERVAVIGDQLFADVLAGSLAGMRTILVEPSSRVEPWFTRIKRPCEVPFRRRLRRLAQSRSSSISTPQVLALQEAPHVIAD